MRLPHLRRHAPLQFLRRCLLRHPCTLCRQHYGHRYPGVERGGSRLSNRRACAERACGGNEHLVRHSSRPRGKHTKADAWEDRHVITLPDGEGLPVVRYISKRTAGRDEGAPTRPRNHIRRQCLPFGGRIGEWENNRAFSVLRQFLCDLFCENARTRRRADQDGRTYLAYHLSWLLSLSVLKRSAIVDG
jgi:hypothetical protein